MKSKLWSFLLFFFAAPISFAAEAESSSGGMTLWQVIASGGWVMVVLSLISVVMMSLVVYLLFRMNVSKLVPLEFSHKILKLISEGNHQDAHRECLRHDNLVASVAIAGLDKASKGSEAAREASEITARKEVSGLWSTIHYLSDIAAIAPMVGLLGTVLGMIEAFNAIAFQTAVVKPILLAGGVSKAMVTTAAGMIVAILAMTFYSLFRSRVQAITNSLEVFTSEILDTFSADTNRG